MDDVRSSGGRERLSLNIRTWRHARIDRGVRGPQSSLGQLKNFAGPCFSSVACAPEEKAYAALVKNTESYVAKFTTPHKCEKSGKTSIARASCGCPVDAGKQTELVDAATKDMKMTYKVGKESTCCSKPAGELVKKSGEEMIYVVAGEETCCEMTARLNLAKAKYAAAVKAIATTEAKSET